MTAGGWLQPICDSDGWLNPEFAIIHMSPGQLWEYKSTWRNYRELLIVTKVEAHHIFCLIGGRVKRKHCGPATMFQLRRVA